MLTPAEKRTIEARNIARKVSHRPAEEIARILNERMRLKRDQQFTAATARDLLKGESN